MNIDDLKNTWESQSDVTNASIKINQPLLASTEVTQQMSKLGNLRWARIAEAIIFFMIVVSLWQYIVNNFSFSAPIGSAILLNIFAIIGLAGNIGQIALISKIDYSAPIKELQQSMYSICSHKLQLTKLVILSVPFYMAYVFIGFDVLFGVDLYQLLSDQMVMFYWVSTLILTVITVWCVSKLSYKNITTPWVKWTLGYIVGEQLLEMAEFIHNAETA